jgi:predicted nucleic acid-binding protein
VRRPSTTIVVDAAVLIAAVRGRSSGAVLKAAGCAILVTTDRVVQEARRRIEFGLKRPELLGVLDDLAEVLTVVPVAALEPVLAGCEETLRDAVPSRNGSTRDAHALALAWSVEADIWTADRDFAGTGVATWSTPNLMRAFANTET